MTTTTAPDTIVLIHGLWMTSRSWEGWADRFRAVGMNVINESWPGLDTDVEALRRGPTPISKLSVEAVVDHYDRLIRPLERPPIIMGHSFGGAFTQVLVDRGLGAAGVAISSAAVKGVTKLPLSTLRTGWPILRNPANRHRAVPISIKQFHYRFTNHLSVEASRSPYDRYYVPAVGRILFQGATANFNRQAPTEVDFSRSDRAPLLFIAGSIDHVSPPALVKANVKKYRRSPATTDYREFIGRSHFILGQDGWQEVADFALQWALSHAPAHAVSADNPRDAAPTAP